MHKTGFCNFRELLMVLIIAVFSSFTYAGDDSAWISLFNGKNLDGWTPKIRYYKLGENFADTFRVEEGLLTISYRGYRDFDNSFGHIFYKTPYSHYRLRMQYRFIGEQMHDGAGWAFRNNGIMIHSQSPESMSLDQEFPVSIEVQLLGGNGKRDRNTGNMCSPGTHIVINDKLKKRHCINSSSKTFHGDQWVTVEVEVQGSDSIKHFINGEQVMVYEKSQYDTKDKDAKPLLNNVNGVVDLAGGYIALQSESHPTQFRNIEILPIKM